MLAADVRYRTWYCNANTVALSPSLRSLSTGSRRLLMQHPSRRVQQNDRDSFLTDHAKEADIAAGPNQDNSLLFQLDSNFLEISKILHWIFQL